MYGVRNNVLSARVITPITHGNVRSKNVLVDDFFVVRLTEFGLDKLMIPNLADEIVALSKAEGCKAPELQRMKKCNSRTDVYVFGILLLEILLGKNPGKQEVVVILNSWKKIDQETGLLCIALLKLKV